MYLEHFKLKEFPFSLTPNTEFFCGLPGYQGALNVLLVSLRSGEGFVKVTGEVGSGKTLLCRVLLNEIKNDFVTAYVPNPDLTPFGLRKALAQEIGIPKPFPKESNDLLQLIVEKLLELFKNNQRVVIILDEAQAISDECLEALRLLTNLETENSKLLQVVLFGQPELDIRLNQTSLRQLKQRIGFSYRLPELSRSELDVYLYHRLAMAGHTYGPLFDQKACDLLYQKSKGLPRIVNILCNKALMVAYGRGGFKVDVAAMRLSVEDTEYVNRSSSRHSLQYALKITGVIALCLFAIGITYYRIVVGIF